MNVKDLKLGAKMTLEGNREFRIIDIRKENNKDYIVCCTNNKPISSIIFEYKVEEEKIKVKEEKDNKILKIIYKKIIKENL